MRLERFGRALATLVLRHRWLTVLLGVVLGLGFASGIRHARFSTDYRIFFSRDDAGLAAFVRLENVFSKTDNVLFVVHANEGTIFSNDALDAVHELTEASWQLPHAARVDSLDNFQHAKASADDIVIGNLVDRPPAQLDSAELAAIRRAAIAEPILFGSLLARDERTAGINVTLRLPGTDPQEVTDTATAARRLRDAIGARHPQLDVRVSGLALMNDAFMQASIRDMAVMLPAMLAVVLAAMLLLTRSAYGTLAVALVLLLTAAMSMALAGWLRYPLTPPAVAAPMIVLTVAVADGVHIVLAAMRRMRAGADKHSALVESVAENFEAITYAWLTTLVGFASLNFSEAPPVIHLANMTCLGVTAAFVYSLVLLPVLLSLLPLRARSEDAGARARSASRYARLVRVILRHRGLVLGAFVVCTVAGGWSASKLETNDQFVRYFSRSLDFRRDVDFTMQHLTGIYRLEYQIGSGEPGGVGDPAYLERLDGFATWLRQQPEVQHVYSLTDVVAGVHAALHPDEPSAGRLPASREAVGQTLLLYEMGLPSGLELTDRIDVERASSRLTVTVRDLSTREMKRFTERAEAWMTAHLPATMHSEASGPVVIFAQLGDRNAQNMVKADALSLLLISLCMMAVLRSFELGLLSIVPNVVPIVLGYGIWRLFAFDMNVIATVAATIALGIIVDDTIHFLTKFRATAAQLGPNPNLEVVLGRTLAHVGPAMISTTVILALGFGVLTLSSFQMTSHLGWLSMLIVVLAVVGDLLLVPALIAVFYRHADRRFATARRPASGRSVDTQPAGTP